MIRRKILGLVLALSMIVTSTGCGSNSETNKQSTDSSGKTIRMITWSNAGTVDGLKKINEKFYEETGITVELIDVPSTEYDAFLKEKINSGDVDIFCYTTDSRAFAQPVVSWAPSELLTWEEIITKGKALDLTGHDFIESWGQGAEACKYDNRIYGISTGMTIMNGLFYNKKMFDEHGWHEPRTWTEFIELCDDIKDAGIAPITVGGKDTWPVQMITNAIVDSVEEGKCAELSEGLWKGTRSFTDERSMEVFNREFQILSYMEDGYLNISYSDAPAHFTEGNVAMLYDGSWNATEIEKANPDFEYDYFAIPGDTKHNFTGKYDLTLGVYAGSDKTGEVLKWLEFFSMPDNYTIYIDSNGFVPTMSWISTSNKFLMLINDRIKDAERTYECYNRVPTDIGPYGSYDLINYSAAGGVFDTPKDLAEAAKKDWDLAVKNAFDKK